MAIQFLNVPEPIQRKPSAIKNFSNAIGESLQNENQRQTQMQQISQENEAIKKNFGIDLSGIQDPKQRQILTQAASQGSNAREIEGMKQAFKTQQQGQKQDFVSQLLGGQKQQQPGMNQSQDQMNSQEMGTQQSQDQFNPRNISDEDIVRATAIDKPLGDALRAAKDTAVKQDSQKKSLEFQEKAHKNKEVTSSYNENKEYINKTYDQYEDSLRREAITDRMDQLEESGELSDSGVINLLESLGLKPEWLKNPSNEEYSKLGLDLLGGGTLQADYGSRVLASEFKVSQQRIPTLSQTPEGRKQIKENIRAMLLPARLKQERMQYYLDRSERTGEPLPHDLRGKVLKDIKPQLEEAYDQFKQRNGRYKVSQGTYPDDNSLEKYYYISGGDESKAMKMMKEDGYDIE